MLNEIGAVGGVRGDNPKVQRIRTNQSTTIKLIHPEIKTYISLAELKKN